MQIIIIGGFLGGGKTTTLNYLVQDALDNNLKPAVIMNEFGKMSVDGKLLDANVPMDEIVDGCICCAMKVDVSQQLHQLYLTHQPDIVFIECSGVAEPIAVVDACLTPVLAPITTIRSILGIVDAKMYKSIQSYPKEIQGLFYEQLHHCSTLFVNKIDLVEMDHTAKLLCDLEVINESADIRVGTYGELPLKALLQPDYVATKDHGTHHEGIGHRYVDLPDPLQKDQFIHQLEFMPKTIFRIKGFVRFQNGPHIYLVQYAQGEIELSPIELSAEVPLYLVAIGTDLDLPLFNQ
ncbi:CobW family GTP-binding protein [Staphylococcus auricularis]|uniref:GTP-binding protein n=1 Tax=Staphylococcus auricularis TaxID=29379 RepID=A0AAW7MDC2_9STAP|nr:GTP-binding protein [Staphylococcus auricularis]MDC6327079.1 GTP-binding protein [Staphylococcus auricularis]MDN4533287.1 GTP-binding protein [Staphylococcus auricularis]